jgi:hypothetical protein
MIARQKQPKLGTVRPLSGNLLSVSRIEEMGEPRIELWKAFQKRGMHILKAPPASKPNVLDDYILRCLCYLSHTAST